MIQLYATLLSFTASAKERLSQEKGATAVEYGLLVALIAAVIIAVVATVGQDILAAFTKIADKL